MILNYHHLFILIQIDCKCLVSNVNIQFRVTKIRCKRNQFFQFLNCATNHMAFAFVLNIPINPNSGTAN